MNTKKSLTLCAAVVALALPIYAQNNDSQYNSRNNNNQDTPNNSDNSQYNSRNTGNNQNNSNSRQVSNYQNTSSDCAVSKILNAKARSTDNQDLGQIQDVIINPQSGKVDFVVLGKGGVLGIGQALGIGNSERIPVPWPAVSMQGNGSFTVNLEKSKLQSAPSINKDYSNLSQPGYVSSVYEFYGVSQSSNQGMGGSESPGGMGQGNNHGGNNWKNNNSDMNQR